MRAALIAVLLFAPSAAVAHAQETPPSPIELAFDQRMPVLRDRAAANDGLAQYALALLTDYGLRGVPRDPSAAMVLKNDALRSRGGKQSAVYIPPINGVPGRMMITDSGRPGVALTLARQSERCAQALHRAAEESVRIAPRNDEDAGLMPLSHARIAAGIKACGREEFEPALARWLEARPWGGYALARCADADEVCRTLNQKIARLNARDPVAEAEAAAARGEFGLGGHSRRDVMGHPTGYDLPGVQCAPYHRPLVAKWHMDSNAAYHAAHHRASMAFLAAYNRRLVTDPGFPYPDLCQEGYVEPPTHYEGVVRTAAEAARSRDPAKVAALPAGADMNAPDPMEKRPLYWATRNRDAPMIAALVAAGADPNRYDFDQPAPLAVVIDLGHDAAITTLLARGARMEGQTGLCQRPPFGPINDGPHPNAPKCDWPGLLIAKGRLDLLVSQAAAAALSGEHDLGYLQAAFLKAVQSDDLELALRLEPHVAPKGRDAASLLQALLSAKRPEFTRRFVLGSGALVARSEAEAKIWRAAALAGQDEALAFLYDHGAHLNLLPPAALAGCEAHAAAGAIEPLAACIAQADIIRGRIAQALAASDVKAFNAQIAQASDVAERNKSGLVSAVGRAGTVAMLRPLLARGASPNETAAYLDPFNAPFRAYTGPHAPPELTRAAWMNERLASPYLMGDSRYAGAAALNAAIRGDTVMLRLLVDAGASNLVGLFSALGDLGNGSGVKADMMAKDEDTSTWPDGPSLEKFKAMELLAAEIARRDGPQAFAPALSGAVYNGYDHVLQLMLRHGFSAAKTERPEMIWINWTSLQQPCKPATGRLLLQMGLPVTYPVSTFSRWTLLQSLAAGCRNPRSVAVLLGEAKVDVNEVSVDRQTAVDIAKLYDRPQILAGLRAAGGKTAEELLGKVDLAAAYGIDPDLDQIEVATPKTIQ